MVYTRAEDKSIRILKGYKFKMKGTVSVFDKVYTSKRLSGGGRWIAAPSKFVGKPIEVFKAVATPVSGLD